MSDIDLYTIHPDHYDKLQQMRPDYVGAQQAFMDLAYKYLEGKERVSLVDFCGGVGEEEGLIIFICGVRFYQLALACH